MAATALSALPTFGSAHCPEAFFLGRAGARPSSMLSHAHQSSENKAPEDSCGPPCCGVMLTFGRVCQHKLSAESPQQDSALQRHGGGHGKHQLVALCCSHESQPDPGVACTGAQCSTARLGPRPYALALQQLLHGGSVLHASLSILGLQALSAVSTQ